MQASDAKDRFGELLEDAISGRERVQQIHEESIERFGSLDESFEQVVGSVSRGGYYLDITATTPEILRFLVGSIEAGVFEKSRLDEWLRSKTMAA